MVMDGFNNFLRFLEACAKLTFHLASDYKNTILDVETRDTL
jgi:hypothetical protein